MHFAELLGGTRTLEGIEFHISKIDPKLFEVT